MLAFDAVVYNVDRHFGNFGVLVDNETGRIEAPAPLFDHGMSFLYGAMESDFNDVDAFAKWQLPRAYDDFIARTQRSMGRSQREKLRRLLDFEFEAHPRYNWPAWRRQAMAEFVRKRARVAFLRRGLSESFAVGVERA